MSDNGRRDDVKKGFENLDNYIKENNHEVTRPRAGRSGFSEPAKESVGQAYEGSEFSIKVDGLELTINTAQKGLVDSYASLYAFAGLNQQSAEPVGLQKYIEEAGLAKKDLTSWEGFREAFNKMRDLLSRVPYARRKDKLEELDSEIEEYVNELFAPAAKAVIEEILQKNPSAEEEELGERLPEKAPDQIVKDIMRRLNQANVTEGKREIFARRNIHPLMVAVRDAKNLEREKELLAGLEQVAKKIETMPREELAEYIKRGAGTQQPTTDSETGSSVVPPTADEEGVVVPQEEDVFEERKRLEEAQVSFDTPEEKHPVSEAVSGDLPTDDLPSNAAIAQKAEMSPGWKSEKKSEETEHVTPKAKEKKEDVDDPIVLRDGETPWDGLAEYFAREYQTRSEQDINKALHTFFSEYLRGHVEVRNGMGLDERTKAREGKVWVTTAVRAWFARELQETPKESPVETHKPETVPTKEASVPTENKEEVPEEIESTKENDAREREELINESGGMREVYEEVDRTLKRDLQQLLPGGFFRRGSGINSHVWKNIARQEITDFMEGGGGEKYERIRNWLLNIGLESKVSVNRFRGQTVESFVRTAMEEAFVQKNGAPRRSASQIRGLAQRLKDGPGVPNIS